MNKTALGFSLVITAVLVFIAATLFNRAERYRAFSRDRLNDGIQVGAPNDWRWARDGIEMKSVRVLMGDPIEEHDQEGMMKNELGTWRYTSEIEGAIHHLLFNRDGFLVGCRWYVGIDEDPSLDKPKPSIKENLKIDYPRCVPMKWEGDISHGYEIDVQIRHPDGTWSDSASYYTSNNIAIHQHTGSNEGRWRVRQLSKKGYGPWSEWVEFECIR